MITDYTIITTHCYTATLCGVIRDSINLHFVITEPKSAVWMLGIVECDGYRVPFINAIFGFGDEEGGFLDSWVICNLAFNSPHCLYSLIKIKIILRHF